MLTSLLHLVKIDSEQRNESVSGDAKMWSAISTLIYKFSKTDNDKVIKCSVYHEAGLNEITISFHWIFGMKSSKGHSKIQPGGKFNF